MLNLSINTLILCALFFLAGCASHLDDVVDPNAPTMKTVYENYTGVDQERITERQAVLMQRPAVEPADLQVGLPPHPERLDHLYPRLPNPDLFMYVRPHVLGISGAPVPAYLTRFSMYERQPYALPGETLDAAKILSDYQVEKMNAREAEQDHEAEDETKPELFHE